MTLFSFTPTPLEYIATHVLRFTYLIRNLIFSKQSMEEPETRCNSVYEGIPPLSPDYAWLICQNLERDNNEREVQSFHPIHDRLSHCQCPIKCRIPELDGRRIRGYYHGWLILSSHPENIMWYLWNPVTSKFIRLPPLLYKDGDSHDIGQCCLSSPPHDPNSILLVTRSRKTNFVFCRLDHKIKKSRWVEMSYAKKLEKLTDADDILLDSLAWCNGKVYAMGAGLDFIIQLDIVVKEKEVIISLLSLPEHPFPDCNGVLQFLGLKGSSKELFCIQVYFDALAKDTLDAVYLFKLDMTSTTASKWEEIDDLKDAIFFLNCYDWSIYYNPAIAAELGGCVHILAEYPIIHSYHVKNRTVYLSYLTTPELARITHFSSWQCRLEGDHYEEAKCTDHEQTLDNDNEIVIKPITDHNAMESSNLANESHVLNIPFHLLEMILEFCVGVEYLNFRATCKQCHLAAPLIQWRSETALRKWQTYSLVSPWLMVLEDNRGIMHFTDP